MEEIFRLTFSRFFSRSEKHAGILFSLLIEKFKSFVMLPFASYSYSTASPLVGECMAIPTVHALGDHAVVRFLKKIGEHRDEGRHDEYGNP